MGRLCFWLIPSLCSRYKRVFSVGTHGITTYNPTTLEVTNQVSMNENAFMMYEPLLLPPVPHRCLWDVLLLALCGPHFLNGLVSQLWIYFSVFIGAQNLILLYCCIIASYKTFIFMLLVHLEALGNFLNVWTGLLMLYHVFNPVFSLSMSVVDLWRHLRYWPGRKRSGHRVQPHIP